MKALCLTLAAMTALPVSAGESCTEDAMIVFDGSGSMAEIGFNAIGEPRIVQARQAMRQVLPDIAVLRRLGLVIYGPGGDRTCRNVDLRLRPQWQADTPIISEIEGLRPAGGTALTDGVRLAAETLDYLHTPGAVVLVTDGKETCGGTPCQLAAEFAREAPGLTVHVIGFKVRSDHWDWNTPDTETESVARCLADDTGGQYLNAETVDDLIGALRVTLGCNVFGSLENITAIE
ncbi:VWA domain-containing protein [Sagittula sp. P11]|uniref:vWA domain-containing protein n=1 Tax=Sagittula sp. P11 TaxID=2009329 RepID=UPI0020C7AF42|nr:VWA domain-containing protein [Sagittula sp. P11]